MFKLEPIDNTLNAQKEPKRFQEEDVCLGEL
jgi:hypothetical protein